MASRLAGGGAFWLAVALGLSGLIAYELSEELPLTPRVVAASRDAGAGDTAPTPQPAVALPSEDLIGEIVDRPLFSPLRRPIIAMPLAIEEMLNRGVQSPTWELVGTMLAAESPIALLRHPTDGLMRLRKGQQIDDWTVTDIQGARVSLENGDRTETLFLRKDQANPGSATKENGTTKAIEAETDESSDVDENIADENTVKSKRI